MAGDLPGTRHLQQAAARDAKECCACTSIHKRLNVPTQCRAHQALNLATVNDRRFVHQSDKEILTSIHSRCYTRWRQYFLDRSANTRSKELFNNRYLADLDFVTQV
jgi:hypothetical protein